MSKKVLISEDKYDRMRKMQIKFKSSLVIAIVGSALGCSQAFADDMGRSSIVEKVCAKNNTITYDAKMSEFYTPPSGNKTISYPDPEYNTLSYYFLNFNGGKCVRLTTRPGPNTKNHCEIATVTYKTTATNVIVSRGEYNIRMRPHQLEKYLTLCDY